MDNDTLVSEDKQFFVTTAQDLTHVLETRVMPITGLILFEAFFGLFGNILILIVYTKYYKRSNFRYFIQCLACIDLLSCCTTLPTEAYVQMNWYSFENDVLCKVKSYLNVFTIFASALILMLLASDRYQKICHPFSKQIEPQIALRLCIISIVVSVIVSIPTAIFWGIQSYDFTYRNITIPVTICEKSEYYSEGIYPMIYMSSAFCGPMILLILLSVYFNIAITWKIICRKNLTSSDTTHRQHCENVCHDNNEAQNVSSEYPGQNVEARLTSEVNGGKDNHKHSRTVKHKCFIYQVIHHMDEEIKSKANEQDVLQDNEQVGACQNDISTRDAPTVEIPECVENYRNISKGAKANGIINYAETTVNKIQEDISVSTPNQHKQGLCNVGCPASHRSCRERRKAFRNNVVNRNSLLVNCQRKTLIMIILSTVFLVSMAIYFALILLVADVSSILRHMSTSQTVVFFFFWRLYFVNSAINPVLYGLMDKRFRQGLRKLCCRCHV